MRLYVNSATGDLQTDPNYSTGAKLSAVYGPGQPIELQFGAKDPVTGFWTPVLLNDPTGMIFGLKNVGQYDGDFVTSCSEFTAPGTAAGFYTGFLSCNTDAIKTYLKDNNDPSDDVASMPLNGQVDWRPNGSAVAARSNPIGVIINNSIVRGDEGATTPADPSFPAWNEVAPFKPSITGFTGGGASNLDGLPTVGGVAPLGIILPRLQPVIWEQRQAAIVSSSVANPSVITTSVPHGIPDGATVAIGGHAGSTPDINGDHVATVLSPTTFSIPVDVTVAGAGGFATPATDAAGTGIVRPADFNAATNARFWKSVS